MLKPFEEVYNLNSVTVNVINKCNLHCTYCFEHAKNDNTMDEKTAIDIMDKCYKKLDPKIGKFTFNIFGGEPLLNWSVIKAMLDYANKKHMICKFGITTNLTLLTDEMIKYVDDNDIMLLVSYDGLGHDENRCNTKRLVEENIKRLVSKGLGFLIEGRMTITPDNGKYLYESIKALIDLGVNNICPICVSDTEWSETQILELKISYKKVLDMYVNILNDSSNKRNISIKYVDELLGLSLEPIYEDKMMCHIGSREWCAIDTNGDVYPCHNCPTSDKDYVKAMLIGNIYTGVDDSKVSDNPIIAKFDRKECKECIAKPICKSGCPLQNLTCNGDIQIPTKAHCQIFKMYAESIKEYQSKLLNTSNSRSRYLNLIKENLKVKEYMDEQLLTTEIHGIDFVVKLDRFEEMYDSLSSKGNVLPSFDKYFKYNIAAVMSWIMAEKEIANNGKQRKC